MARHNEAAEPVRPRRSGRVWLRRAGLVLMALAMARGTVNLGGAETRVQNLCVQITPRMTLPELERFAAENSLDFTGFREGIHRLPDKKSMGRQGCTVLVAAGRVQSSTYFHLD